MTARAFFRAAATDNDPSFTIPGSGTLTFEPGQLGWYGPRKHYPDDGHEHTVRVRIASSSGCCGDLYYLAAYDGNPFLEPSVVAWETASTPARFELRQAVGRSIPAGAQLLGASDPSMFRASVAENVQRAGEGWSVIHGITRLLISVPESGAASRVRVRII